MASNSGENGESISRASWHKLKYKTAVPHVYMQSVQFLVYFRSSSDRLPCSIMNIQDLTQAPPQYQAPSIYTQTSLIDNRKNEKQSPQNSRRLPANTRRASALGLHACGVKTKIPSPEIGQLAVVV